MNYRFGPFRIEPQERRLFRQDVEIHLQPKTFDTLVLLIERRGHLVSKDDLMNQLWPDQIVTEHSITRCIREVRKALGDSHTNSQYIETIPKGGYRFVAPVEELIRQTESGPPKEIRTRHPAWLFSGLVLIALLLAVFAMQWVKNSEVPAMNVVPVLAILPFENETGSEENDLVLAGLAQDIRERLSSSGRVAVTSGISASALGSVASEETHWPEALNADWLLKGSLAQDQKRQFMILQMVSAAGVPGWQKEIEIISGDLIGLADKIAIQVASILGFSLPEQARFLATAASVESINAHHQYLLARGLIAQRTPENVARAIQVLHEVLELMPNHANAMAALGIAYMLSPDQFYPAGVASERAEGLFQAALEINPDTALAWAGRALAQVQLDSNVALQKDYINKALELNPFDADVLGWAANVAGSEGRIDDAFGYFQRALVVDPLHTSVNGNLSFNLAAQGRYDQAEALLENAGVRLGDHPALYYFKVRIATITGDLYRALQLSQDAISGWPDGIFFMGQLASAYATLQMREEALWWSDYAVARAPLYDQAIGAKLGVAFAFDDQSTIHELMEYLLAHPDFDDLRPHESPPWILTKLVEGNGYLGDCGKLQQYLSYQFEGPESLEGRRGTITDMAHLAHWKAWCLRQDGHIDESLSWLDKVTDKFEFMKSRGLRNSLPHMYIEAQNFALRGDHIAALDLLQSMIDSGWLNQGLLEHDPRWSTIRGLPEFQQILESVTESTTAIREQVEADGLASKFQQEFQENGQ